MTAPAEPSPPPFGSWRRTYAATVGWALLWMLLLWWLTAAYHAPEVG